jgi:hypothetical protein
LCFSYTTEYESIVKNLASSYDIKLSDDELQKGMPLITEYIEWLKCFQKN